MVNLMYVRYVYIVFVFMNIRLNWQIFYNFQIRLKIVIVVLGRVRGFKSVGLDCE